MGLFGGPHKTVKRLDEQLSAARAVMGMWGMLPQAQRDHACTQVPKEVAAAARAAAAAGQADGARAALDAAAAKPPAAEPPELTWASVIDSGREMLQ